MRLNGRTQRFDDNINTDYIIAAQYKALSLDMGEMAKHTFEDIDPDFVERTQAGDIVVAGRNFGCGSSRRGVRYSRHRDNRCGHHMWVTSSQDRRLRARRWGSNQA